MPAQRIVVALLFVALLPITPLADAETEVDPCGGVHFLEHLSTITFVTSALRLLNGTEDFKLSVFACSRRCEIAA